MSAYSTADQIELGQMDNAQKSVSTLSAAAATAATILGHVPSLDELKKPYLLPKESPFHVPPHVTLARMDDQLRDLQLQVKELQMRNYTKDTGKKFEGSWTRVGVIMVITYCTLFTYMYLIDVPSPFLNAIVPTVGFNLSTWSLPQVKRAWIALHDWNYGVGRAELAALHDAEGIPLPAKPVLPPHLRAATHISSSVPAADVPVGVSSSSDAV